MSSQAIKKFFAEQRKAAARQEAWLDKLLYEMEHPKVIEEDKTAFNKHVEVVDSVLKRNWFLDNDDLLDLLWDLDEETFQEIYKRIGSYPYSVQQTIGACVPMNENIRSKLTLKIREITDDEAELRELQQLESIQKEMDDAWENYKKDLQPPVGYLDAEYDDMFAKIQVLKKDLDVTKKKAPGGRYVPPSMREKIMSSDPKVVEIELKIKRMENEIDNQKQRISQEHNGWFLRKRCEFEQKMCKV